MGDRILNSHCFYLSVTRASASTPGQGSKAARRLHPHTLRSKLWISFAQAVNASVLREQKSALRYTDPECAAVHVHYIIRCTTSVSGPV